MVGLRISRPWLGYADAFFLELGALHVETLPTRKRPGPRTRRGQAGVMIDSGWRVEQRRRFVFGRDSEGAELRTGMRSLEGRRVRRVALDPCGPELRLELEGGLHVHSFATFRPPCWALFLGDPDLFPRDARWFRFDHSLLVTVDEDTGKLAKKMCYGRKPGAR